MNTIALEMQRGREAEAAGNLGRMRVCARRAAGLALRSHFQQRGEAGWVGDAMTTLTRASADPALPPAIRAAATRLITVVNHDHQLPFPEHPLADAQAIIDFAGAPLTAPTPPAPRPTAMSLEHFRRDKDNFFKRHPQSPLTPEQKRHFTGLNYFPENPALDLEVEVTVFPTPETISIPTSTGQTQTYQRYGQFRFEVDGQPATLTIYAGEHGFFLPFVDALAGVETYPAGRYLEPERLAGNRFAVDFNLAYNPYCAYNDRWSCPLTPAENRLRVAIRAGEKLFAK